MFLTLYSRWLEWTNPDTASDKKPPHQSNCKKKRLKALHHEMPLNLLVAAIFHSDSTHAEMLKERFVEATSNLKPTKELCLMNWAVVVWHLGFGGATAELRDSDIDFRPTRNGKTRGTRVVIRERGSQQTVTTMYHEWTHALCLMFFRNGLRPYRAENQAMIRRYESACSMLIDELYSKKFAKKIHKLPLKGLLFKHYNNKYYHDELIARLIAFRITMGRSPGKRDGFSEELSEKLSVLVNDFFSEAKIFLWRTQQRTEVLGKLKIFDESNQITKKVQLTHNELERLKKYANVHRRVMYSNELLKRRPHRPVNR